jgi:hypothetical protein
MPIASWSEIITASKDIAPAVATAVGMYVAVRGLNTWNRQLKGSVEYDLTRRLLKGAYRLREAIKAVRNPIMLANEQPPPPEEGKKMNHDQRRHYGLAQAYQNRWNKVVEARNDLQTDLLEAEVIWGQEIYNQFKPLFKLQHELFADIHSYLVVCNPDEHEESRQAMAEIRRKRREVLYDLSGEEPDQYSKDMAQAISAIETHLKPHLKK